MKQAISLLRQTASMLSRRSRRLFTVSVILFVVVSALRVLAPVVFAMIVANVQDIASGLAWGSGAYAILFFCTRFLEELRLVFYAPFEQEVQKALALRTIDIFFRVPLSAARARSASENAVAVDRGLGGLRAVLYSGVFALAPLCLEGVAMLVIIGLRIDPLLAAWAFIILSLFLWITTKLTERIRILQEKWFAIASVNYKILSESLRSYETIRSFDQRGWASERYGNATQDFIEKVVASLRPGIILGLIQGLLLALLIGSTVGAIISTNMPTGEKVATLVLVNGLLLQIVSPLLQFSFSYRQFIQGLASARQLLDLLATQPVPSKIAHERLEGGGEFRVSRLTVAYDKAVILDIFELTIPERKLVTISGVSGSGKSTLARCLAGLCQYGGVIHSRYGSERIFFMTQDVHVFDISIQENIALGLPICPDRISWALRKAGISDGEYEALADRGVGEGGANVSGGQRQRIGLARMLYHDVEVLIFDEPTSALDGDAFCKVLSTMQELSKERTCIVVTHDQRCIDNADLNIQLADGKVI